MDFFEAVERRHSYRGRFEGTPVPRADIEKMLGAALCAPSGMNYQTTSFIAVTNPGIRAEIHKLMQKPTTETAPLIIVVCTQHMPNPAGLEFEREDYGAAVENLLLAVTALGYASVWIDGYTRSEERDAQLAQLLNVPAGKTVRAVLPVGVPLQQNGYAKEAHHQKERRPFAERAQII